jgi:hypothetical protein
MGKFRTFSEQAFPWDLKKRGTLQPLPDIKDEHQTNTINEKSERRVCRENYFTSVKCPKIFCGISDFACARLPLQPKTKRLIIVIV